MDAVSLVGCSLQIVCLELAVTKYCTDNKGVLDGFHFRFRKTLRPTFCQNHGHFFLSQVCCVFIGNKYSVYPYKKSKDGSR